MRNHPHLLPIPQHLPFSALPHLLPILQHPPLPFPEPLLFDATPVSFPFLSTSSSHSSTPALFRRLPSAPISFPLFGIGPAPPPLNKGYIVRPDRPNRMKALHSSLFGQTVPRGEGASKRTGIGK